LVITLMNDVAVAVATCDLHFVKLSLGSTQASTSSNTSDRPEEVVDLEFQKTKGPQIFKGFWPQETKTSPKTGGKTSKSKEQRKGPCQKAGSPQPTKTKGSEEEPSAPSW